MNWRIKHQCDSLFNCLCDFIGFPSFVGLSSYFPGGSSLDSFISTSYNLEDLMLCVVMSPNWLCTDHSPLHSLILGHWSTLLLWIWPMIVWVFGHCGHTYLPVWVHQRVYLYSPPDLGRRRNKRCERKCICSWGLSFISWQQGHVEQRCASGYDVIKYCS